jgi:hypothetical protein
MSKINSQPPPTPMWPWGGPRSVRERLIDRAQLDRKKLGKAGNPKAPALASAALLDFIGPAHTSEELRLPLPPYPDGHDADVEGFLDRPYLNSVAKRAGEEGEGNGQLERALPQINASQERLDRLKALLKRESQMLDTVGKVASEMQQILHLMWEAQKDEKL